MQPASLNSCDVDAAVCGAVAAVVTLLSLFFLCSYLCSSSANASFLTTFFRSNLSAPCGAILRNSSIRSRQRSEWVCARFLSMFALHPGHSTVDPNSSSGFVLLHLALLDWDWVDSNFWSNHCPIFCLSTVLVSVSHLLRGSSPQTSRTPSSNETFCNVVFLMPCQIPKLYQGFILFMESVKMFFANTFSPKKQTLPTVSCHAVSRMVFSRHDLSDTWMPCACSTNHCRTGKSSLSSSCVLLSM